MRILHSPRTMLSVAALVLLGACGDKPQTAGTHSSVSKSWQGSTSGSAFTAPGWKAGDEASWDAQIKQRNRGQNDYARMAP